MEQESPLLESILGFMEFFLVSNTFAVIISCAIKLKQLKMDVSQIS